MISPRLTSASRQTAIMLVWLLLCATAVPAREFSVQTLSDPKGNARNPSIGETGLVAWQAFFPSEPEISLSQRPDVLRGVPSSQRSDIILWRAGQTTDITAADAGIVSSERPHVFRDSVVFNASFRHGTGGGYPFKLSIPPKTEVMQKMESDYPELFDPPRPAIKSAVEAALEAENAAGGTNPPPAEPAAEPAPSDPTASPTNNLKGQHQMWRHGGQYGDIAVYRQDGNIERLTPGEAYVSMPVMSEAGVAFQHARGWPYGYEIIGWKPGTTNLIQITTNYFYALNADIHGNELVFQAWDGDDYEIYLYRFDTEQLEQITNNQFDDISPVVWNGQIAWIAHPTVTAEIFFMADGVIRKISEGTEDNSAPSIWEGKVVWQGYDDTDLEIYYFNGRRTVKLTSNTWDDMAPKICDGVIAWMSYVDNWDGEIMALDLGDNTAIQLTDNDFEDFFPQTVGEKIVWQTVNGDGSIIQMATPKGPREGPLN
jgi:hypothetical protein